MEPAPTFADARDAFVKGYFEAWPTDAARVGLHEYDCRMADASPEAMEAEIERLRTSIAAFEALEPNGEAEALDRAIILSTARTMHFFLTELKMQEKNPLFYIFPFMAGPNLLDYIVRDDAPASERAAALGRLCDGLGAHFELAKT